jgi:ATP-dependent Clp protease ATP-binding subunit ClpB
VTSQPAQQISAGARGWPSRAAQLTAQPPQQQRLRLLHLLARLAKQNITLTLDDSAKKFLGKEGYDPAYGARPLKRVIQRQILDPLSLEILDGHFGEGDHITATEKNGRLVFEKLQS